MGQVLSNHIGGSSELLVLADIKPGFIPVRQPVTYAARLRRHLKLLDALRRQGLESDETGSYVGPIDTLRTLQFIQWTMIDNDTRMLLMVSFDQPFEPYIRRIVDVSGALLDTIFCHCQGFEGKSSDQGFHRFMEFIDAHQAPVELFAAAAPDLSVDDGDFYIEMDSRIPDEGGDSPLHWLSEQTLTRPAEKLMQAAQRYPNQLLYQGFGILDSLFRNAALFPNARENGAPLRDDILYYNLVDTLMPGFWRLMIARAAAVSGADPQALGALYAQGQLTELVQQVRAVVRPDTDPLLAHLLHARAAPLTWYARKPPPRVAAPQPQVTPPHGQIQGGLLEPRTGVSHAGLLLLRVDDPQAGRQFLQEMEPRLWPETPGPVAANLSITKDGLRSLGMDDDALSAWPRAFREGMAERAGLLGDVGVNHPSNWVWPRLAWPLEAEPRPVAPFTIDIIVQLSLVAEPNEGDHAFSEQHPLFPHVQALADTLPPGVRLLGVEPMLRRYRTEEKTQIVGHLGFVDGVSQPRFDGRTEYTAAPDAPGQPGRPETGWIGDLLIGHGSKLDAGRPHATPPLPLRDGTFQVIRKTRIDVARFKGASSNARLNGAPLPPDSPLAGRIQAKMIGRYADGSALDPAPADDQDFNYTADPKGHVTPLQSHIRRCNPRESDSPRIIRRGFSYGPFNDDPDADRGMMFIAYNASLAEQFETVQRWVSGGNSTGLTSTRSDPILGPQRPGIARRFQYVEPGDEGGHVSVDLGNKPVCTLQWGLYAFTPSRAGLRDLAALKEPASTPPDAGTGARIRRLTHADPTAPLEDWQMLLEDTDQARRDERARVWADIRAAGGVLETSYAVLVGGADAVRSVILNRDDAFSTDVFHTRMCASVGPQYLGFDRTQDWVDQGFDHDRESRAIGDFLNADGSGATAFAFAYERTGQLLRQIPDDPDPASLMPGHAPRLTGRAVRLDRLILDLIAEVCRDRFGLGVMPDMVFGGDEVMGGGRAHCPGDLLSAAAYIFGPHPGPVQTELGQEGGKRYLAALEARVNSGLPAGPGTLLAHLQDLATRDPHWTNRKLATTLAGVAMGLTAPVSGSFAATLLDWIDTRALWRHQQRLQEAGPDTLEAIRLYAMQHLLPEVLNSMCKRAAPDLTHRRAVKDTTLAGCQIKAGQRLVLSLGSAAAEAPEERSFFLFGGGYAPATGDQPMPHHGCPGRDQGLNTILGAISALLTFSAIDPLGPLSVRLKE